MRGRRCDSIPERALDREIVVTIVALCAPHHEHSGVLRAMTWLFVYQRRGISRAHLRKFRRAVRVRRQQHRETPRRALNREATGE